MHVDEFIHQVETKRVVDGGVIRGVKTTIYIVADKSLGDLRRPKVIRNCMFYCEPGFSGPIIQVLDGPDPRPLPPKRWRFFKYRRWANMEVVNNGVIIQYNTVIRTVRSQ